MKFVSTCLLIAFALHANSARAQKEAPLTLRQVFPLPEEIDGTFDHFGVDLVHKRLFVTPMASGSVLVLDLETGKVLRQIKGLGKPHSIVYRADTDRLFITDGIDGSVRVFAGTSYTDMGRIKLRLDADAVSFDAGRRLLYVNNGGRDIKENYSFVSILDTDANKKLSDLRLDGDNLEASITEVWRPRMYVNNRAKSQVDVIDTWTRNRTASWPLNVSRDNVAIALDELHARLFVACRGGSLLILSTDTGKEIQTLPLTKGVDDLTFDDKTGRVYASADGAIDTFERTASGTYALLGRAMSGANAKTGILVPATHSYYTAVPKSSTERARVLAFDVAPPPGAIEAVPFAADPGAPQSISAPYAEELVLAAMSAHPEIHRLGLHTRPPGTASYVITAQGNPLRIGAKSNPSDLKVIESQKMLVEKNDKDGFFNLKLPLSDAHGHAIGVLIVQMPFVNAPTEADAVRIGEKILRDVQQKIPDLRSLFQFQSAKHHS